MNRILVVVFDDEPKAIEGRNVLLQLAEEGSITVYAYAIVAKNADGTATVRKEDDDSGFGMMAGAALGSLIGLLGGPTGSAVGAIVGLFGGNAVDAHKEMLGEEFIEDVTKELTPNRTALAAEIDEGPKSHVDSRMEPLGAIVFRRDLSDVKHILHEQNVAERKRRKADCQAKVTDEIPKASA